MKSRHLRKKLASRDSSRLHLKPHYFPSYFSFSKTLPHDSNGIVDPNAFKIYLKAITTQKDINLIPLAPGSKMKLVDIYAAQSYVLGGLDLGALVCPTPPTPSSPNFSTELLELYEQALVRDVPFDQLGSKFRGTGIGDMTGPYLSQFFLADILCGAVLNIQKYKSPDPLLGRVDFATTVEEVVNLMNGIPVTSSSNRFGPPAYINTGRQLAEAVHNDPLCILMENAWMILSAKGIPPNPSLIQDKNMARFATLFGGADTYGLLGVVSNLALRHAWYNKYQRYNLMRGEQAGLLLHQSLTSSANHFPDLNVNNPILKQIYDKYQTYLLPQAYPEGSPAHPSYPSGHAAIVGACSIILKAAFDTSKIWTNPVVVGPQNQIIIPYLQAPAQELTIEGELNKFLSNISIGRNWAGIHYRSDAIEGIKLGEEVAIAYLRDHLSLVKGSNITVRRYHGEVVVIKPN